jgi:pimeloyl-ACP methyl ester carboxylesterase
VIFAPARSPVLAAITGIAALLAIALWSPVSRAGAAPDDLACDQEPGNRYYWLERAFCDLPPYGPEQAHGLILWNHGISGTTQSWKAPAPPVLRLLQFRGWDVIMLKRHHLAETMAGGPLYRTAQRTLQEAAARRKQGYKKIVLAGQSFGGYVSLDAADSTDDIDAVVALAPGVRFADASSSLDPSITDRILKRVKVGRLMLLFPKDDGVFGNVVRGESARAILSRRSLPYLLLDETSGISGHGGGHSGRFALRYGLCLSSFLSEPSPPAGRYSCPAVTDEWLVVRDLLVPPAERPTFMAASVLPESVRSLIGPQWALLEDSVVLVVPLGDVPERFRLMYRSTTFRGGVFDAAIKDGAIQAVLSNKSTVTLSPEGDGTITWRSSDGSRSLKATLIKGRLEP